MGNGKTRYSHLKFQYRRLESDMTKCSKTHPNVVVSESGCRGVTRSHFTIDQAALFPSVERETVNATEPRCFGNAHLISPLNRASDSCSPFQVLFDRADSNYSLPFSGNGKNSDMANLTTDMELKQASTQRTFSRMPSPQPQLTPCEQLKFNKTQLAKLEAFRNCK
ncbi:hypothetical protein TNCV_2546491 [Trichonephila clavipes]|nr:hypothetical protein TNCV_2546491 [Trichonephila clavipes]